MHNSETRSIPVGCVPPACWPYLPACTAPEGLYGTGGRGGLGVSQHALRQTPPPVNKIIDPCKNIIFPQLRLRAVIDQNYNSKTNKTKA